VRLSTDVFRRALNNRLTVFSTPNGKPINRYRRAYRHAIARAPFNRYGRNFPCEWQFCYAPQKPETTPKYGADTVIGKTTRVPHSLFLLKEDGTNARGAAVHKVRHPVAVLLLERAGKGCPGY
jgi:hypothetical protein